MRPALALLIALFASSCASPLNVAVGPAAWPLRGTPASDASAIHRRPLVVKVANDPGARPQTGIADADLIIELPVEGGLTRLSVVFQSKDPSRVGPVRSARQSDLNYLPTLHAILAHVGASESVTKMVRDAASSGGFVDIDEFQHADAFERSTDRVAPYNAYTSASKLRQAAGSAAEQSVDVGALEYGDAQAASTDGATLTIPYAERVRYEFDPARGAYHRTAGGTKTLDTAAGEVLPENVVVIKTDVEDIPGTADAAGAPSVDYRGTGSGPVVILRDGKRFDGTWSRQGTEMYRFADASGKEIGLKPGLTWMHIVPTSFDLSG
ncbi:MAG: DUF3048 domain-containing protein [Chloroflexi bacterium]|nr:MAG: DUF3048 domain-containing protein [Chloroflexota bacterium]